MVSDVAARSLLSVGETVTKPLDGYKMVTISLYDVLMVALKLSK